MDEIFGQVNLLGRPERSLGFLVHLPDIMVLDGEDDKATWVVPEERFVLDVDG